MQPCENAEVKTTGGVEYLMCKIDGTPCHVLNIPEWCAKKERYDTQGHSEGLALRP